ncbi:hypothetical protein [Flavobacterium sp.]|uniref:hypothetical protein n=1 Tax=Flavobacterium sp. TaxID=239 RepID=UPI003D6BF384
MKLFYTSLCIGLSLFNLNSYSQENETPSPFWENITIRKSFESRTDNDEKPANLSFTFPKEKEDIFKINAGIGYSFSELGRNQNHELTVFYVYNKNNQIDKRQENYKFGLAHNAFYRIEDNMAFINETSVEYLNDNAQKSRSFLAQSYLQFYSNREDLPSFASYALKSSRFAYQLNPKIGLEYQTAFDAESPLQNGYNLRSYFNIGGSILLKKKTKIELITVTNTLAPDGVTVTKTVEEKSEKELDKMFWKKGLEIVVNYEGRNILSDNFDGNPNYLHFFKGELKLYPIDNDNLSIGLSYNKGESPIDGLGKQEFWMLSFNFLK